MSHRGRVESSQVGRRDDEVDLNCDGVLLQILVLDVAIPETTNGDLKEQDPQASITIRIDSYCNPRVDPVLFDNVAWHRR